MTGFAGWITWAEPPASAPHLLDDHSRRFDAALDSPIAEPAVHWQEGGVLLTHRQAITAPEDRGDRQPRTSDTAPFVLLFDGYLINRADLIRDLRLAADARFWPDSALALAALEAWGDQAVARLLGDFALALWDRANRRLLLARDVIGSRPVYYHQGEGFLAFATTPRALLALPGVPKTLNEARFIRYLVDAPARPGEGFYAAITPLPAAALAVATAADLRVTTYWTPDFNRRLVFKSDADYEAAARELLDQAVAACLRVEGPPVVTLTGGFDSTAVAVTALKFLPEGRLTTITSVSDPDVPVASRHGAISDERPYVEAFLERYPQVDAHFVSGSGLHHWDTHWQELFLRSGVPWRNIMNLGWMAPARDKARDLGARVLITGNLGNLTLSWDGRNAVPTAAREGRWGYALRELRAISRRTGRSFAREFWRYIVAPHLSRATLSTINQWRGGGAVVPLANYTPLNPDFLDQPDVAEMLGDYDRPQSLSPIAQRRGILAFAQSANEIIGLGRAVYGLEQRSPLADRRLLEFCFALPDSQYMQDGIPRRLVRRVVGDQLPPKVLNNTKRGFQCPEYFHRMGLQREELEAALANLEHSPLANRLLDVPRLRKLMAEWPDSAEAASPAYFAVLHRGLHYGSYFRWLEGGNR